MPILRLPSALRRWPGRWLALAGLTACTVARQLPLPRPHESACAPATLLAEPPGLRRLSVVELAADTALIHQLTPMLLNAANAAGLVPRLRALRRTPPGSAAHQVLAHQLRQQVARLSAVVQQARAELRCEQDRAAALATELQAAADAHRRHLLLLALGLGLTGLLSFPVLKPRTARAFFAQAPGVVCLLVAAGAAWSGTQAPVPEASFAHPRNALGDVRHGPAVASALPPTVWAYLTQPAGQAPAAPSRQAQLRARWRTVGRRLPGSHLTQLLYEQGGLYHPAELRVRAQLLGELDAQVQPLETQLRALAATLAE
jgi:hypothetical protein